MKKYRYFLKKRSENDGKLYTYESDINDVDTIHQLNVAYASKGYLPLDRYVCIGYQQANYGGDFHKMGNVFMIHYQRESDVKLPGLVDQEVFWLPTVE